LPHLLTLPERQAQEDVRDDSRQQFTEQEVQTYAKYKKLSPAAGKARLHKLLTSKGYKHAKEEVQTAVDSFAGVARAGRKTARK
jgi:hypothetical protein